jgi:sec-independent protein translocase protein TatC
MGWAPMWTVREYYSFVTRFTIGFGLAFELPVVVLAPGALRLDHVRVHATHAPICRRVDLRARGVHHPTPDILTLIAMGLPMYLLYESCIWIAWFMQRKAARIA